jgi:MarR family transcriptional regulator, organic hydroperoxide resistance regulator
MVVLEDQLCFLLYETSRIITRIYEPLLKPLDLTYPQYLVLLSLREKDDSALDDLATKLNLDSGTLTPLLKRLQRKDLITRTRCQKDERKLVLNLTEMGRQLIEKNADTINSCVLEGIRMSDAQRSELTKLLKMCRSCLSKQS